VKVAGNMSDKSMSVQRRKNKNEWGLRLKSILSERKISLRKAAAIAGVSPSVMDSWTSGATPSDMLAVKKLSDSLGVSFSWLLTGQPDSVAATISLQEHFEESTIFSGIARIKIDRLTPRKK
jgi:transcriptional regulator with XRE-family HTH domain